MGKGESKWSVLRYMAYFSQVGVTVVVPPLLGCFGAVWLRNKFGWGNGVVIAGLLLGVGVAFCGLRDFLRFTERKARESERRGKML